MYNWPVTAMSIVMDRASKRSRGFGFVEMAAPVAERAIEDLEGLEIDGRAITVGRARPKKPQKSGRPATSPRKRRNTPTSRHRAKNTGSNRRRSKRR